MKFKKRNGLYVPKHYMGCMGIEDAFPLPRSNVTALRKGISSPSGGGGTTGGSAGSAPAAGNNVVVVAATKGGLYDDGSTVAFNMNGANVTSGNVVFCGVSQGSEVTYTAGMLTKTAGTSTVGTIALDKTYAKTGGPTVGIYRIPVTGTGTLTLTFNPDSGNYLVMGCVEFSGINASPVSTTNGTATGTGSGGSAIETTGSVSSTDLGVMIYCACEASTDDYTRTAISDVEVFKSNSASAHQTGLVMYKVINSSPNTLTNTWPENVVWSLCYQLYKST